MQRAQAHTRLKTHERHTETTQDPYTQRQKQSYCPARAETLDRCTARARPTWVLPGGAACAARITHAPAHTHKTTRQGNGARQTAYRPGTAHDKRRREHHEATKMPKKMKPNRTYMPAECRGVTTPLLPPAAWGGMGEGWVRGRRWDGRRGSYAAHLQSTTELRGSLAPCTARPPCAPRECCSVRPASPAAAGTRRSRSICTCTACSLGSRGCSRTGIACARSGCTCCTPNRGACTCPA